MAKTYEPIATFTVNNTTTSNVTFSNIASTWTDLKLVIQGSYTANGSDNLYVRFNGDSSSIYSLTLLYGDGTSASSSRLSTQAQGILGQFSTTAGATGTISADIMNYSNTSIFKTILSTSDVAGYRVGKFINLWRSTSAINQIYLFVGSNNFTNGTIISLYGIKAYSPVTPILASSTSTTSSVSATISNYDAALTYTVSSTAGTPTRNTNTVTISGLTEGQTTILTVTSTDTNNISSSQTISLTADIYPTGGAITTGGGYRTHTFTASGTFIVPSAKTIDYAIVGGGGGGAGAWGGGGGGGGVIQSSSVILPSGSYPISVGSGGSGATSSGTASSFNSVSALGGGLGGIQATAGTPGASGGGGGAKGSTAPPFTFAGGTSTSPTQGNSGGSSTSFPSSNPSDGATFTQMAGGGGGAGAVGTSGSPSISSTPGGNGKAVFAGTFGGGGGGITQDGRISASPYIVGSGGTGGGGSSMGGTFPGITSATSGSSNTGGGGGAGWFGAYPAGGWTGGNGGSGIVVIRYLL